MIIVVIIIIIIIVIVVTKIVVTIIAAGPRASVSATLKFETALLPAPPDCSLAAGSR